MRAISYTLKTLFVVAIIFSFAINYYVHIVKKEHTIFTYPDEPDTSDYIIEE